MTYDHHAYDAQVDEVRTTLLVIALVTLLVAGGVFYLAVTTLAPLGGAGAAVASPRRRRLPDDRTEIGRKFRVGEYEGYIHVGVYDVCIGDIFVVDIAKEGTTLAGPTNSFMISVSLGLQYGVPLEVYVSSSPTCASSRAAPRTTRTSASRSRSSTTSSAGWARGSSRSTSRKRSGFVAGGASPDGRGVRDGRPGGAGAGPPDPGPDGALQHARGRDRVLALRRADGQGGDLLHVPGLRDKHRVRLMSADT